jgi:hypothetical protein
LRVRAGASAEIGIQWLQRNYADFVYSLSQGNQDPEPLAA